MGKSFFLSMLDLYYDIDTPADIFSYCFDNLRNGKRSPNKYLILYIDFALVRGIKVFRQSLVEAEILKAFTRFVDRYRHRVNFPSVLDPVLRGAFDQIITAAQNAGLQIFMLLDEVDAGSSAHFEEDGVFEPVDVKYITSSMKHRDYQKVIARGFAVGITSIELEGLLSYGVWSDQSYSEEWHNLFGATISDIQETLAKFSPGRDHSDFLKYLIQRHNGYEFYPSDWYRRPKKQRKVDEIFADEEQKPEEKEKGKLNNGGPMVGIEGNGKEEEKEKEKEKGKEKVKEQETDLPRLPNEPQESSILNTTITISSLESYIHNKPYDLLDVADILPVAFMHAISEEQDVKEVLQKLVEDRCCHLENLAAVIGPRPRFEKLSSQDRWKLILLSLGILSLCDQPSRLRVPNAAMYSEIARLVANLALRSIPDTSRQVIAAIKQFASGDPSSFVKYLDTHTLPTFNPQRDAEPVGSERSFKSLLVPYLEMLSVYDLKSEEYTSNGFMDLFYRRAYAYRPATEQFYDLVIELKYLPFGTLRMEDGGAVTGQTVIDKNFSFDKLRVVPHTTTTTTTTTTGGSQQKSADTEPRQVPVLAEAADTKAQAVVTKKRGRPKKETQSLAEDEKPQKAKRTPGRPRKPTAGITFSEFSDDAWRQALQYAHSVSRSNEVKDDLRLAVVLLICLGGRRVFWRVAVDEKLGSGDEGEREVSL